MKFIKNSLILLIFLAVVNYRYCKSDNRIVIYLRHAPPDIIKQAMEESQKEQNLNSVIKVKNIDNQRLASKYRKLLVPKLSGFSAIYGGFIDISNRDGMIQFPLRQADPKLYVAFTEKIKLIKVKGNTFSHCEFADFDKHPTQLYICERKTDDKKNPFWSIQKTELPQDKKISPLTVVIFTNPSNVVVQTGDFLSNDSQHFVLPAIYVICAINQELTTLNILKVKKFFEAVKFNEKTASEKSSQGVLDNI